MKVVIASCTSQKRNEPAPARDLYDESPYFQRQREYAELADEWWIQSAKHGLVHPERVIKPYDKKASEIEDPDVWAWHIATRLVAKYNPNETTIVVLGGKDYADPLTPQLEWYGFEVHEPFRGMRIGERMSELARRSKRQIAPEVQP